MRIHYLGNWCKESVRASLSEEHILNANKHLFRYGMAVIVSRTARFTPNGASVLST